MKFLILYFSGTGNTDYIASYLYSHLIKQNLPIEITKTCIETFPPEELAKFDIVCFGFPVFELNSPQIVRDYLKKLTSIKNKGVYLFCTKGFAAGNAFRKNFKYFSLQGYYFLGSFSIIMPGSDGLAMMDEKSKFVQKVIKKDYSNLPKVDTFVEKIMKDIKGIVAGHNIKNFKKSVPFNLLDFLFGWSFNLLYIIMIIFIKKSYRVDNNCNKCSFCVKICPVQNITLESDGIHFSNKCITCLRCIHHCPTKSIQIGRFTVGKFRWHGPDGKFKPLLMLKSDN